MEFSLPGSPIFDWLIGVAGPRPGLLNRMRSPYASFRALVIAEFVHLEFLRSRATFTSTVVVLHVRNQTVNAGVGHHAVTGFQAGETRFLLLFLPLLFAAESITKYMMTKMKMSGTENEPMPPPGMGPGDPV